MRAEQTWGKLASEHLQEVLSCLSGFHHHEYASVITKIIQVRASDDLKEECSSNNTMIWQMTISISWTSDFTEL